MFFKSTSDFFLNMAYDDLQSVRRGSSRPFQNWSSCRSVQMQNHTYKLENILYFHQQIAFFPIKMPTVGHVETPQRPAMHTRDLLLSRRRQRHTSSPRKLVVNGVSCYRRYGPHQEMARWRPSSVKAFFEDILYKHVLVGQFSRREDPKSGCPVQQETKDAVRNENGQGLS